MSSVNEEEFDNNDELESSPNRGKNVRNHESESSSPVPGISVASPSKRQKLDTDTASTNGGLGLFAFHSLEESCLTNHEEAQELTNISGKPRSPVKVSDFEFDNEDNGSGSSINKTITELQNYPSSSDPVPSNQHDIADATYNSNCDKIYSSLQETEETNGWESPASSQGSMKSADYVYKLTEQMNKNSTRVHEYLLNPNKVLPKELYKLFQDYFEDKHAMARFMSFVNNDVLSKILYQGETQKAELLKKQLESQNDDILKGVIGRILLEKYTAQEGPPQAQSDTKNISAQVEKMEVDENKETVTPPRNEFESGRHLITRVESEQLTNNTSRDVKIFRNEQVATCSTAALEIPPPIVPSYLKVADVSSAASTPTDPTETTIIEISDRVNAGIWEDANDKLKENAGNQDKQIEKIGQVFFDAAFTNEEKVKCTFSGKGNNKDSKFVPFHKCKIRFIRFAVAFVLSEPPMNRRTTRSFQKAVNNPKFEDLKDNQWDTLKKRVFNEYAYRQRPKKPKNLKKEEQ